jgi:hypothetical protein
MFDVVKARLSPCIGDTISALSDARTSQLSKNPERRPHPARLPRAPFRQN